jgi:competence protein ComEC
MKKVSLITLVILLLVVGIVSVAEESPAATLEVRFLDVGQGDAIFIDYGEYEILVDGGRSGGLQEQISHDVDGQLDLLVATHPDADHIGGLDEVLAFFAVAEIWTNGAIGDSQEYRKFDAAVIGEGAEVRQVTRGYGIVVDGLSIEVLHPVTGGDANNYSVVLLLTYSGFQILLTGDIEETAEQELVSSNLVPDVDILKVAHHGSANSSSLGFLITARPEIAVYSASTGNSYGHPAEKTLNSLVCDIGAAVYGTDTHGTVSITVSADDGIVISTEKQVSSLMPSCFIELPSPQPIEQTHDLRRLTDLNPHDWYKVYLDKDTSYEFWTSGSSDTYGELRQGSSSGKVIAVNDDGGSGSNFFLTYIPPTSGWYYLDARMYSIGESGDYSLSYKSSPNGPECTLGVFLNEIEANPAGTDSKNEWVELYNCGGTTVDLSGWSIAATHGGQVAKTLPNGTSIGPHQYLVVYHTKQWLDNSNEVVELRNRIGTLIDRMGPSNDSANNEQTWARGTDGDGAWVRQSATKGYSNE